MAWPFMPDISTHGSPTGTATSKHLVHRPLPYAWLSAAALDFQRRAAKHVMVYERSLRVVVSEEASIRFAKPPKVNTKYLSYDDLWIVDGLKFSVEEAGAAGQAGEAEEDFGSMSN